MDGGLACARVLQKDYRRFKEVINSEGTPLLRAHGVLDKREKDDTGKEWSGFLGTADMP